jgi:hypothetical protein
MEKIPHDIKAGYYWYTIDGDPPTIMHVHDNGTGTLMGTDFKVAAIDIAGMVQKGETFIWIEPPPVAEKVL